MMVSMFALFVTVTVAVFGRGMMKLIPILIGILCGYIPRHVYGHGQF